MMMLNMRDVRLGGHFEIILNRMLILSQPKEAISFPNGMGNLKKGLRKFLHGQGRLPPQLFFWMNLIRLHPFEGLLQGSPRLRRESLISYSQKWTDLKNSGL